MRLTVTPSLVAGALFVLALASLAAPNARSAPPAALSTAPLQLTAHYGPTKVIPAVPFDSPYSAGTTLRVSATAPFCLQGFPAQTTLVDGGPGEAGDVYVGIEYLDDEGVSHPAIKIYDGASGGATPLDLAIVYGNVICARESVQFTFHQTQPQAGDGSEVQVHGRAIVMAAAGTVVTFE